MIASVRARYENGVLTPLEPLDIENGSEVTVSIEGIDQPFQHVEERRVVTLVHVIVVP